jgi:hypothetical protein
MFRPGYQFQNVFCNDCRYLDTLRYPYSGSITVIDNGKDNVFSIAKEQDLQTRRSCEYVAGIKELLFEG